MITRADRIGSVAPDRPKGRNNRPGESGRKTTERLYTDGGEGDSPRSGSQGDTLFAEETDSGARSSLYPVARTYGRVVGPTRVSSVRPSARRPPNAVRRGARASPPAGGGGGLIRERIGLYIVPARTSSRKNPDAPREIRQLRPDIVPVPLSCRHKDSILELGPVNICR